MTNDKKPVATHLDVEVAISALVEKDGLRYVRVVPRTHECGEIRVDLAQLVVSEQGQYGLLGHDGRVAFRTARESKQVQIERTGRWVPRAAIIYDLHEANVVEHAAARLRELLAAAPPVVPHVIQAAKPAPPTFRAEMVLLPEGLPLPRLFRSDGHPPADETFLAGTARKKVAARWIRARGATPDEWEVVLAGKQVLAWTAVDIMKVLYEIHVRHPLLLARKRNQWRMVRDRARRLVDSVDEYAALDPATRIWAEEIRYALQTNVAAHADRIEAWLRVAARSG